VYKIIADFLNVNSSAFQATYRTFVEFCRQVGLISGQLVAIDGSKFQAVASQRKHLSLTKLKRLQGKLRCAAFLLRSDPSGRIDRAEYARPLRTTDAGAIGRDAFQAAVCQPGKGHGLDPVRWYAA